MDVCVPEKSAGKIASIVGRFYAMDRDKRWARVKEAYDLLVNGIGKKATLLFLRSTIIAGLRKIIGINELKKRILIRTSPVI